MTGSHFKLKRGNGFDRTFGRKEVSLTETSRLYFLHRVDNIQCTTNAVSVKNDLVRLG